MLPASIHALALNRTIGRQQKQGEGVGDVASRRCAFFPAQHTNPDMADAAPRIDIALRSAWRSVPVSPIVQGPGLGRDQDTMGAKAREDANLLVACICEGRGKDLISMGLSAFVVECIE